jgi:omega-amidase
MQNLTVALIQANLAWEDKSKNIEKFSEVIDALEGVDAVFLPETFTTGFTMNSADNAEPVNGPAYLWMRAKAIEHNSLITGSVIVQDGDNYYNRLYAVDGDENSYQYNKRHLFRMGDEHMHYQNGSEKLTYEYKGWKLSAFICYDLRFPVWCRNTENAHVLYFVANWPQVRIEHWKSLLVARAIENQCYVIGVSRVGVDGNNVAHNGFSMIVSPKGEIIDTIEGEEGVLKAELDMQYFHKYRETFPAHKDADKFDLARDLNY